MESRWFTRGWTLQEPLATKILHFFTFEGKKIENKKFTLEQVHKTTGNTNEAFQGTPIKKFSIFDQLSWAETRNARRGDDAAYSLQGLFDIRTPLKYGEGQVNAMK
jgi:hypothetical protein